jgi:hypothetical protein
MKIVDEVIKVHEGKKNFKKGSELHLWRGRDNIKPF